MAERVVVVDDLDGSLDARHMRFSLDGVSYRIDLAAHNIERLNRVLAPFIAAARPANRRPTDRATNRAIRAWAARNGIELNPQGRIPNDVVRAYHEQAATPQTPPVTGGVRGV